MVWWECQGILVFSLAQAEQYQESKFWLLYSGVDEYYARPEENKKHKPFESNQGLNNKRSNVWLNSTPKL